MQPAPQIEGFYVTDAQAGNLLLRDLMRMIMNSASEEALLARIQQNAPAVFGRELDHDEARQALAPVLVIAQVVSRIRFVALPEEEVDEGPEEKPNAWRITRLILGGIGLKLRMKTLLACPQLVGAMTGRYTSLDGKEHISIREVLDSLGGMEGLASGVVHRIETIRTLRAVTGSAVLLDFENMEFLRRVLFFN